jgi:PAS domain S-box-containing protein
VESAVGAAWTKVRRSLTWWLASGLLALAAFGLWFGRVLAPRERARFISRWRDQLSAMADDRSGAVERWVGERFGDATLVAAFPTVAGMVGDSAGEEALRSSADTRAHLDAILRLVMAQADYLGVVVLAADGRPVAGVGQDREPDAADLELARECLRAGRPLTGIDLHNGTKPVVHFVAPIVGSASAQMTGAVLLISDPESWLYPFLGDQTVLTDTAETVLVQRDGDAAVFVTPLRHSTAKPLTLRRPLSTPGFAATVALGGSEEFGEYVDYRGASVLACARHVRGTPWGLVVKVDRDEALAGYRRWLAGALAGLAAALLAVSGLGYGMWHRYRALAREAAAGNERRLAEMVHEANDAVFVLSVEGRVLQANLRAEELYGYSAEQFFGMSVADLRAPETRDGVVEAVRRAVEDGSLLIETVHRRRDGSTFPAEVSTRRAEVRGQRFLLATVRDITPHKVAAARIRSLNRILRTISEINQLIVRERDRDQMLKEACRILVEHGEFRMAWVGFADEASGTVIPEAWAGHEDGYLGSVTIRFDDTPLGRGPTGTAIRDGRAIVVDDWETDESVAPWREDGRRHGYRSSAACPLSVGGKVIGTLTVYAGETSAFDTEVTQLLAELTGDVAFALEVRAAEAAQRESEARYRMLFEGAVLGVFQSTPEGRIINVNPAYARMFGFASPAELMATVGDVAQGLYAVPERRRAIVEMIFASPNAIRVENLYKRKDGSLFTGVLHAWRVHDASGAFLRLEGFVEDISERMRTEAALRESEDRYRDLVEQSHDLICTHDLTGRFLSVNPVAARVSGYSINELLTMNLRDFLAPDVKDQFESYLATVREKGAAKGLMRIVTRSGERRIWEYDNTLRTEGVATPVVRGLARDVTDRIQAEEALRQSERRLAAILNNVQDAYFRTDLEGRLVMVSPSAVRMFGYASSEEMIGRPAGDLYADSAERDSVLKELRKAGRVHDRGGRARKKDGTEFWVSLNTRFCTDGQGRVLGCEGFVRDITERKRAEEVLHESREMLRESQAIAGLGSYVQDIPTGLWKSSDVLDSVFGIDEAYERSVDGWAALIHPDDRTMMVDYFRDEVLGKGQTFNKEYRIVRHRDQAVRWVHGMGKLEFDSQGRPLKMRGTIQDVTERKRADDLEGAIYEISEAAQQTAGLDDLFTAVHRIVGRLMEARNLYIALYDSTTNLLSFPYFVDEVDERPDPFPAERGVTSHVVRTGQPLLATPEVLRDFEERGEIQPLGGVSVDWLGVPLKVQGRLIGVLAVQSYSGSVRYSEADKEVLTYISAQVARAIEHKRAEDALRESEARFELLAKTAPVGIFRTDEHGATTYVNRRWTEISGLTADRALGYGWLQAVHPEDRDRLAAGWRDSTLAEHESLADYRFLRPDGTVTWVVGQASAVLDAAGHFAGYVGTITDITDRKRAGEALRESEIRFRTLFESANDAILLMKDRRFVDCNARTLEVFGCNRDQILNHSPAEFSPETQRDGSLSASSAQVRMQAALAGEPQSFEWLHCRHDRSVFETEVSLKRIELSGEAFLQAIVRDITAHKQADSLRTAIYEISDAAQQAATLDDLFAAVHRIIGRLMEAKNLYIALYDPAADLISFPYYIDEETPPSAPRRGRRGLTEYILRTGTPLLATPDVFDDLVRRGEVESIGAPSIDWLGVPLKVQGRVIGVMAAQSYSGKVRYSEADKEVLSYVSTQVAQAIERKRAEEALREDEERFRGAFDDAATGMALVALDGRWLRVNRALCEIVGYAEPELLTKTFQDITHPADLARDVEAHRKLLAEEVRGYETEKRYLHKDGHTVWAFLSVSLVRDSAGHPLYFISHVNDLTDRKQLEGQLLQAQKMEAVGSLAGGVAHDFNNLLQAMLSQAQLLRTHADHPERVKTLALELGQQISHGALLTRQLLLFSRRETTRPEPLDLNDAVTDATRMLRRLVRANIALEIELAPETLPVTADRGQLEQVLMNLTLNASDAMPEGGKLMIRTGALDGERVWLTVEDTGIGIPEAIRDRIFEPFFTTKEPGKGTGLGLSVVHGIVTQHGGRIEVESAMGSGTTFRVILPKVGSGEFAAVKGALEAIADIPAGKGERILVVEDEDAAREGLRDILRGLGYEVITAASGEEAGRLPEEPPFDVLLTDLMLPGISGSQLAAGLQERWPSLRVILMSGYTEDEAVRREIGEGNVRFLQKPFAMARLAREIREALAQAPEHQKPG